MKGCVYVFFIAVLFARNVDPRMWDVSDVGDGDLPVTEISISGAFFNRSVYSFSSREYKGG